jgi:hypothetical protein
MSTTLASQVKTEPTVHVGSIREVEDVLAASHHRATVICFRGSRDKGPANANLAKNFTEIATHRRMPKSSANSARLGLRPSSKTLESFCSAATLESLDPRRQLSGFFTWKLS